jgi:hypothetical protein
MTLKYLETLLVTNPTVQVFTGLGCSDYPNPTRQQVLNAFQALVDQSKYLAGYTFPPVFPDSSQASLAGGGAVTVMPTPIIPVIGLNTGPNMDAYVENVMAASQVE